LQASTVAVPLLEEAHGDFEVEEFTQVISFNSTLGFVIIMWMALVWCEVMASLLCHAAGLSLHLPPAVSCQPSRGTCHLYDHRCTYIVVLAMENTDISALVKWLWRSDEKSPLLCCWPHHTCAVGCCSVRHKP
jgi:hypothetical protein